MSKATVFHTATVLEAANKAVFGLQLNTNSAVRFIRSEVPSVTPEVAAMAVDQVARPSKKYRVKK